MNAKKNNVAVVANVVKASAENTKKVAVKKVAVKKVAKKTAKKAASDKVMKARATRHAVKVGGKKYDSAWSAFKSLKLGTAAQCARFRKSLKASGRAVFENGKRSVTFQIVKEA